MATDKAAALAKIPAEYKPLAEKMAATGIDWAIILNFVLTYLPQILDLFRRDGMTATAAAGHCPEDIKAKAEDAVAKACASYCAAVCLACCCGCHDHDH
jgi:hypothetical protein